MAYDAECLEAELLAIVQNNLGAKLTEISTEKGDSLSLPDIDSADYYSSMVYQEINADPFIRYGITASDPDDQNMTSVTARSYTVIFEVVFMEDFSGDDTRKKAFRYIRALKEVIDANFNKLRSASVIDVIEVLPTDFVANDDQSTVYKIGGVNITATIG